MRFRRRTVRIERETVTIAEDEATHDDPPWQPGWANPKLTWSVARDPEDGPDPWDRFPKGIDELDPDRDVPLGEPPRIGNRLLRHPPVTAPWRAHLGFTADLAARAARHDMRPVPVPRPRTYPELDPDTLAQEFEPLAPLPDTAP